MLGQTALSIAESESVGEIFELVHIAYRQTLIPNFVRNVLAIIISEFIWNIFLKNIRINIHRCRPLCIVNELSGHK